MRIAAVAILFLLAACSSVTLNPAKREFWLGGTVDPTDRARLDQAAALDDSASARAHRYVDCMAAYGLARARTSAAASEIADAAGGACVSSLDAMQDAQREAADLRIAADHPTPRVEIEIRDRINAQLAQQGAEAKERGRQAAMRAVVACAHNAMSAFCRGPSFSKKT